MGRVGGHKPDDGGANPGHFRFGQPAEPLLVLAQLDRAPLQRVIERGQLLVQPDLGYRRGGAASQRRHEVEVLLIMLSA